MMLCCLHDGFNGTVGLSLSQVFLESISEDGQLAIGLEATEGFLGLQQAGGGPSERHLGVSPAFDVAGDLAHRAERVLDDVGAGERAPEFVRQAEADDGEDLLQPLQDAARDARFLMLQTPDQVAQEPLGLVCVVLVPGLTERLLDARVQMLGQALDDVTALVDLAALDGGGHTEGVSDRFAECLRAIDDEQPRQCRIEPPGEEIVDQGWTTTVFSVAPSTTARTCLSPLPSTPIAAIRTWSPTCRPSIWMTSRSSSERSEASQAFIFLRDSATKRRETADFEVPSPRAFARSPSGSTQLEEWVKHESEGYRIHTIPETDMHDPERDISDIPLSQLELSPDNMRKTPADASAFTELKASIAAHGLLENLITRSMGPGPDGVPSCSPNVGLSELSMSSTTRLGGSSEDYVASWA